MRRIGLWIAVFAAAGVLQLGCGKKASETAAEKTIESAMKASGQDADVSVSGNAMSVTTKDGTSSFGEGTKVPDNWPSDVPVYSGLKVLAAVATPQAFSLSGTTGDALDKISAFYKEQAVKNGWTKDTDMTQDKLTMLSYKKEKRALTVVISTDGSDQSVSITIGNE